MARHLQNHASSNPVRDLTVCGALLKWPFCFRKGTIWATYSWGREYFGASGN